MIARRSIESTVVGGPGTTALEFAKEGTDWKITKPIAAVADYTAVDSLLSRVQRATMKSIVTEQATPADLKKYGFDKPQATVVLTAGSTTATARSWAAANGNDVYARDLSKALVATADGALLKDLQKGVDDYRRKEIFAFRGYSTDRLEFTRDGQTIVFEKVKAQGQTPEKWHRVESERRRS